MRSGDHWERQARNWAAFTRGVAPDSYPFFAPRFFELIPPPGRATLEVGCGEGRVCRDLAARGHRVTGVDIAPTMVALARAADPRGTYLVADAAALPFEDRAFDLVVAFNSLMDVDELDASVREAARVLEPGGRLAVSLTHPMADAGHFDGDDPDAPFVVDTRYLDRRRYAATVERNGVTMEFAGWAYPLEDYTGAIERAGLVIEALREPAMLDAAVRERPTRVRWQRIPNFLWIRALKPGW